MSHKKILHIVHSTNEQILTGVLDLLAEAAEARMKPLMKGYKAKYSKEATVYRGTFEVFFEMADPINDEFLAMASKELTAALDVIKRIIPGITFIEVSIRDADWKELESCRCLSNAEQFHAEMRVMEQLPKEVLEFLTLSKSRLN